MKTKIVTALALASVSCASLSSAARAQRPMNINREIHGQNLRMQRVQQQLGANKVSPEAKQEAERQAAAKKEAKEERKRVKAEAKKAAAGAKAAKAAKSAETTKATETTSAAKTEKHEAAPAH